MLKQKITFMIIKQKKEIQNGSGVIILMWKNNVFLKNKDANSLEW